MVELKGHGWFVVNSWIIISTVYHCHRFTILLRYNPATVIDLLYIIGVQSVTIRFTIVLGYNCNGTPRLCKPHSCWESDASRVINIDTKSRITWNLKK